MRQTGQPTGTCRIRFEPTGQEITFDPAVAPSSGTGEPGSILDIAVAHGVDIQHGCGGSGICGTCAVKIVRGMGNLSKPSDDETYTLRVALDDTRHMRLACQAVVRGDVTVCIVS